MEEILYQLKEGLLKISDLLQNKLSKMILKNLQI
jgi:hypothetical protein